MSKLNSSGVEIVYNSKDDYVTIHDNGKFITKGSTPQHRRLAQNVINKHTDMDGEIKDDMVGKVRTIDLL